MLGHLGGHLGLSEALLEPSWAILGALTARDPPPSRSRGGVGGGVKTPSPPARRPAHSHPPSQHISSTRASACSAAVFGWAAIGNQIRPHVRDAGAQACQARLVRQMRHVLHVRQHLGSYLWTPRALSLAQKTIQSARGAHKYDPICCPEVYFVLFFARESARRDNTYDQICCSEVYFACFCKGKCSRGPQI